MQNFVEYSLKKLNNLLLRINMNGLLHHAPSEDTISNILKDFTVVFMPKCYGLLVKDLHVHLLMQTEPVCHILFYKKIVNF